MVDFSLYNNVATVGPVLHATLLLLLLLLLLLCRCSIMVSMYCMYYVLGECIVAIIVVVLYGHNLSQSIYYRLERERLTGYVANPARGQLNREND